MAKPRAAGADAVQLIAKEATYGTAPDGSAGGVYRRMPMRSDDISAAQPLEDDDNWNTGSSEDSDPSLGAFTVAGDLVLPMDVRGVGVALSMALGAAVSAVDAEDEDLYSHTFQSGKDLFSYTKQVGHPKLTTPKWRTQLGGKANGFSFPMARNGRALMTVPMIFQTEVKDTTGARDAAPLAFAYLPFDNCRGGVTIGGSTLANLTGAQFNFTNSLDVVETIRSDMAIDGADETIRKCSGTANLRYGTDSTIDDLVDGGTSAALEFAFTLASNADWWLKFQLPRVFFERTKEAINGPGGIEQAVSWRAAKDASAGYMMRVVLQNDVESY